MSRQIHQDDFSCLQVADTDHSSSLHDDLSVKDIYSRSCKSAHPEEQPYCDVSYEPVNFITTEIYSMIAAWESCETKRGEPDTGAVESTREMESDALYQPLRYVPTVAPPKRFYRRFWRTIARRTLEHARKSIMAQDLNIEGRKCCAKSIDSARS